MPNKKPHLPRLVTGMTLLGAYLLARKIAYAPPDPDVEARADEVARSGPWTYGFRMVNGLRLHYAEIGSGPLVMLLHGFPECWYEWHMIMPTLGTRFHVVAPDMRGYNWSDKPSGVDAYSMRSVSADIAALIRSFGDEQAFVVGHDWGGVVAWEMALRYPELVEKLVIVNAPHPDVMARELRTPEQFRRSLYALFFQLPLLPEVAVRLMLRQGLRGTAFVPGAFPDDALDVYENAVSRPGAATAMLNYYRATGRSALRILTTRREQVRLPTLVIWGMKDVALGPRLLEGLEEYVPDLRIERIEQSGHWVPEEKPGRVAELLLQFFSNQQ